MAHEIYLKLDAILGECQQPDHMNWIILDSFNCSVTAANGENDDFYSGACEHSPIEISKHIDRSSPKLALAACQRTRFANAYIHICQASYNNQSTFGNNYGTVVLRCVLTGVTCLSYNLNGENNSTDSISLKYDIIEWHYTYIDPFTLKGTSTLMSRWDTKANKGG